MLHTCCRPALAHACVCVLWPPAPSAFAGGRRLTATALANARWPQLWKTHRIGGGEAEGGFKLANMASKDAATAGERLTVVDAMSVCAPVLREASKRPLTV